MDQPMALATKLIGGIAAASYAAYKMLRSLKAAPPEAQAEAVRTTRWIAGVMMALCRCIYEIVGVYMGNRPGTAAASTSTPSIGRFGMTAREHEAGDSAAA